MIDIGNKFITISLNPSTVSEPFEDIAEIVNIRVITDKLLVNTTLIASYFSPYI